MSQTLKLGQHWVGEGRSCYIIAEIGINHNGSVALAKQLVDAAVDAGCQAVKFQKRDPELCVPEDQRDIPRETPWGLLTYLEYRKRLELSSADFEELDAYCHKRGIDWFASCWDEPSVDFIEAFNPPCYKVASACLTDHALLDKTRSTCKPLMLSTGMSTWEEILAAMNRVDPASVVLLHTTSAYPCQPSELNLKMLTTLREHFSVPIGYSGHEVGLQTSLAAVALGACVLERHITLDRTLWGSDQAASVEPHGLKRLIRDIRVFEEALGDGVKRVYPSEHPQRDRLRRMTLKK